MNGEIGRRVRDLRATMGLTQAQVAERADLTRATINRIEQGRTIPGIGTLARVAEAIGVTEEQITGHGNPIVALERESLGALMTLAARLNLEDRNLLASLAERMAR